MVKCNKCNLDVGHVVCVKTDVEELCWCLKCLHQIGPPMGLREINIPTREEWVDMYQRCNKIGEEIKRENRGKK